LVDASDRMEKDIAQALPYTMYKMLKISLRSGVKSSETQFFLLPKWFYFM